MRRNVPTRSLPARFRLALFGLCGAAMLAMPALAQDAAPGVQSLIETLDPANPNRLRGIRLPGAPDAGTPGIPAPDIATTTAPPEMPAVSLTVTFATGSAQLSAQAMQVLDNLGQALASRQLAAYRFRVEGHTDTVGPDWVNQDLSERRAASVRDELVRRHGIAASRIEALGFGEQQLLIPTPDETPEPRNRRVQIVNLGG